jgi:hypothetical protein
VAGSATHREIIQRQFIPAPLSVSTSSADRWRMIMSDARDGFDAIGVVVDWIDACKQRRRGALLDFYADDATVECCEGLYLRRQPAARSAHSGLSIGRRRDRSGGGRPGSLKAFHLI